MNVQSAVSSCACHGRFGSIADDGGGAHLAQGGVGLRGEPALVAELEAVPSRRQLPKRAFEPLVVAAERGWQLPEDGPQLRRADEGLDPLVEARDSLLHVA